jgi:phosphoglycolate phosphatase
MLPKPRAVLFDWDNTLVENWGSIQAALNVALVAHGMAALDLEQVKHQGRHSARDIFPTLFGARWQIARDMFYAGLSVMPGAEDLLNALAECRVPLGIVSNKKGELLRREIGHLGWSHRFVSVVGAGDAPADKPDPAPVHSTLENMGLIASNDIWLVGDTDVDMRAAIAAGCSAILVGNAAGGSDLFADAKPTLICFDCDDLTGFVRRLCDTICV